MLVSYLCVEGGRYYYNSGLIRFLQMLLLFVKLVGVIGSSPHHR